MPLAVQQMDLPIGATGLDTGTDERRLPAPKLAVLENARIVRGGKLQKRRGLRYVTARSQVTGLFAHDRNIYALTREADPCVGCLTSSSPSSSNVFSAFTAGVTARALPVFIPNYTVTGLAKQVNPFASVVCQGFRVTVTAQLSTVGVSGVLLTTVITDSTGAEVFRDSINSSGGELQFLRAAALEGSSRVLIVSKQAGSNMFVRSISFGPLSIAAWGVVAFAPTMTVSTTGTALVADSVNTQFLFGYSDGTNVRVARFSSAGAFVASATVLTPASAPGAPLALAVAPAADQAICSVSSVGNIIRTVSFQPSNLAPISNGSLSIPSGTAVRLAASYWDTGEFLVAYGANATRSTVLRRYDYTSATYATIGITPTLRGFELTSWLYRGPQDVLGVASAPDALYAAPVVRPVTSTFGTTQNVPLVSLGYQQIAGDYVGAVEAPNSLSPVAALDLVNGELRVVLPVAASVVATSATPFAEPVDVRGVKLVEFAIEQTRQKQCTVLPTAWGAFIGDRGTPSVFDGARLLPLSTAPLAYVTAAQTNAGGSMSVTDGRRFLLAARYVLYSTRGDLYASPPSAPLTVTWASGATSNGRLGLGTGTQFAAPSTLDVSPAQYSIAVQTSAADGTVLYEEVLSSAIGIAGVVPSAAIYRSRADATQLLLPAVSTGLTTTAPPPFRHAAATAERLIGLSADGLKLYTSLLREPGFGPVFTEETLIELATLGQDATAVATIDNTILIFTSNSIYAITGDGPDNNGQGSWNPPQLLVRGYGTTEPQSVINTPAGVWFRGATGWRMLGRDLQLTRGPDGSFLGEEADSFLSSTVYQAVTVPQQGEVRWTLGAAGILVYNYEYNVWSLWKGSWQATCAAADSDGRMWILDAATGNILQESTTSYLDNVDNITDIFVPMRVKTGKINVAGIKGFQRLRRVAIEHDSLSAHGMSVKLYIDGETSPSTSRSWTDGEIAALPAAQKNLQVHVASQKGSYYELEIADTAPAVLGTGEGYHIVGAQVEIGVKMGNAKQLPAGNKR